MKVEELIANQNEERKKCLDAILSSTANKKIIVAGAGTGKTFTFKNILKANPNGENLVMTFIRMLVSDMNESFGDLAEIKTFHAYCKKILHEQNGKVELIPFLTNIIEEDSQMLGLNFTDFDRKFQILDSESSEVKYYLNRGDYYDAVSFNDSVFRLYKELLTHPEIVPAFNQILIDEFQDFNPLEVAFINELEKKGKILIVGDDDQAVYPFRYASPDYLREKFNSGNYEKFELPFCIRCTEIIVNATNAFLSKAQEKGFLKGRINKRYECFIGLKRGDNSRFPKIITVQLKIGKTIAKYINSIIQNIHASDIAESWNEGSEYPTVLIVGPKQYLTLVQNELVEKYPQLTYKFNEEILPTVIDGYNLLLKNETSNLGWRILVNFYFKRAKIKSIIKESDNGKPMVEIVQKEFQQNQKRVLEIIEVLIKDEGLNAQIKSELEKAVGKFCDEIIKYYSKKDEAVIVLDKTKPSILLKSFVGCKGLSAGYVIIVGANDGAIPKEPYNINDVEISQFLVAITRARKQCHIVSNKWHIAPVLGSVLQTKFKKSCFIDWIPDEFIENKGLLSANDIK